MKNRKNPCKIGVFVCGNYSIVKDIYDVCEDYNSPGVQFELNVESF